MERCAIVDVCQSEILTLCIWHLSTQAVLLSPGVQGVPWHKKTVHSQKKFSVEVQRANLTCDVISIRLRRLEPWPISDDYSNFAPVTWHVSYKITTLWFIPMKVKVFLVAIMGRKCFKPNMTPFSDPEQILCTQVMSHLAWWNFLLILALWDRHINLFFLAHASKKKRKSTQWVSFQELKYWKYM